MTRRSTTTTACSAPRTTSRRSRPSRTWWTCGRTSTRSAARCTSCSPEQTPFPDGTIAAKLVAHAFRPCEPQPVEEIRTDVPPKLLAVLRKMMAKKAEDRYQQPIEVAEALAEWAGCPSRHRPTARCPTSALWFKHCSRLVGQVRLATVTGSRAVRPRPRRVRPRPGQFPGPAKPPRRFQGRLEHDREQRRVPAAGGEIHSAVRGRVEGGPLRSRSPPPAPSASPTAPVARGRRPCPLDPAPA